MSGNISLTASMRSNLLSLQNISRTVDATQNKLATGNKVNSAIDNPSSYYTARSLNNRANDLDALLDSMGQAVSTIKTATTALETGATFLEQAAAVATSALETNTIPPKAFFEEKVGENGAVVTTAQELKDAIDAGKETICVYGQIDLVDEFVDISNNKKLVGINYFGDFDPANNFSTIKTSFLKNDYSCVFNVKAQDCEIANLRFEHSTLNTSAAKLFKAEASTYMHDVDILMNTPDIGVAVAAIESANKNTNLLINRVNIFNNGKQFPTGIGVCNEGILTIDGDCSIVISCNGGGTGALRNNRYGDKNNELIRITANAKLFMSEEKGSLINNSAVINPNNKPNRVIIEKGAKIAVSDGNQVKYYLVKSDYESVAYDKDDNITFANIADKINVEEIAPWEITDLSKQKPQVSLSSQNSLRYSEILNQYDTLIKDSSYKGVNLLKNENLNVRFNEKGNADLNVNGKDMSAGALGLNTVDWQNQGDIAQSLKEIAGALKSIRAFTAELGNNYSIITNRQEFTENLINILTEGADKLTLADMNEESANMLSLQTRQQLAINSLSLASQAAQAVLKLF